MLILGEKLSYGNWKVLAMPFEDTRTAFCQSKCSYI